MTLFALHCAFSLSCHRASCFGAWEDGPLCLESRVLLSRVLCVPPGGKNDGRIYSLGRPYKEIERRMVIV